MFFELITRNSRRNRKENGLFFASLLISVIAFYIILSLPQQDVMKFLSKMESDAVNKLLLMVPLFYAMTLFILFFLIYFSSKYQLERRRHEFGIYLMMGMSRFKLFLLLLAEDVRSSLTVLLIGLPSAILLSEAISLVTARLAGLGIIGHQLSVSPKAILWTALGFLLIKLAAFLILSGRISGEEIGALLTERPEGAKKQLPSALYALSLLSGIILLASAYAMAIRGLSWYSVSRMGLTLLSGSAGTFLLFFGLRFLMEQLASRPGREKKLHTFTFRQLQENVVHRSSSLAVSSMLILAAMCCFGAGAAIVQLYDSDEQHFIDYTFSDSENPAAVKEQLSKENFSGIFSNFFEIKVGHIRAGQEEAAAFSMPSVMAQLETLPPSKDKDILLNNLSFTDSSRLISLSGYNRLLDAAGLAQLTLGDAEAAVYMDTEFTSHGKLEILNSILSGRPEVSIAGESFRLTGKIQTTNLVVDRAITLAFALIVPDNVFERLTEGDYAVYLNAALHPDQLKGKSLLTAISDTNIMLDAAGIPYESYLQNIGRQLFYVAAASYITIYLSIIFLIVANTILGVQFLMQLQKNRRRCKTLIRLGASYEALCGSAGKQINFFFGIPASIAAVSSIFGVRALFSGLLPSRAQPDIFTLMFISLAMILLLVIVEYIYIAAVKRLSRRYLLTLMLPEREE